LPQTPVKNVAYDGMCAPGENIAYFM
jgi:hypothetical protein